MELEDVSAFDVEVSKSGCADEVGEEVDSTEIMGLSKSVCDVDVELPEDEDGVAGTTNLPRIAATLALLEDGMKEG